MGLVPFRFDEARHEYRNVLTGRVVPHITGLLQAGGWIDDRWYTEESSERGKAVHKLTADYDLGALDVEGCVSAYKAWLLGHVQAMQIVPHEWAAVEEPRVHGCLNLAGRPDRVGRVFGTVAVYEIKSGPPEKSHGIQTALQAILIAPDVGLPAEAIQRFGAYYDARGKFKLEQHKARRDFDEATRLIRRFCQ